METSATLEKKIINITLKRKLSVSTCIIWWFILRMTASLTPHSTPNTHYLPSLVHPTRAIYSVPGNKEVKGTASSLSCVLTICKYNHTKTYGTLNYHFGEEKTRKDSERLTLP